MPFFSIIRPILIRPRIGGVIAKPLIILIFLNVLPYKFESMYVGRNKDQISYPKNVEPDKVLQRSRPICSLPKGRERGAIFVNF
ncbi:hypothetical protein DYI81_02440 [Acinetobacter sp. SWAC5]|nr:hypothetical protein DYI81_02440 [Acinetobacter sp. SWAC5]